MEGLERSLVCMDGCGEDDEHLKVEVLEGGTESVPLSNDPRMPVHPFFMMLVGPRKQGKSNCALDFIYNKIPEGFFDLIIVYCKTIDDDDKWAPFKEVLHPEYIHRDLDMDALKKEFVFISKIRKVKPDFKTLMIFDDMIQENAVYEARYKNSVLNLLGTMGRHKGISVIFTTQLYKALSTALRNNTTNMCVFYQQDVSERDKIMEANQAELSKDEFLTMYNMVHGNPDEKNFMHINKDQKGPFRFCKNWDQPLVFSDQQDYVRRKIAEAHQDDSDDFEEDELTDSEEGEEWEDPIIHNIPPMH